MKNKVNELIQKELKTCHVADNCSVDNIKLNSDLGLAIITKVVENITYEPVLAVVISDDEIAVEFPVDNNWAKEDRTHAIGKRQGAKWMRDKLADNNR